jgi:hypothetical protein
VYYVGAATNVKYDPADPSQSEVDFSSSTGLRLAFILAGVAGFGAGLMMLFKQVNS